MSADLLTTPLAPRPRRRALLPGLFRREAAAEYSAVGLSTWDRLTAAGLTPEPVKLGGAVLWSRRELAVWIDHGCPNRATWTPIWQALVTARRTRRAK